MRKGRLIIIRHARNKGNIRETDDPNAGLTDFGFRQAERVGDFLKKYVCDQLTYFSCYTSPFLRCLQTAEKLFPRISSNIHSYVVNDLREYINHGYQEVSIDGYCRNSTYAKMFSWQDGRPTLNFLAETNEEFLNRMYRVYDSLAKESIVVTHGLPALMLLKIATGKGDVVPIWDHSLDNASITLIENGRLKWHGRNLYHELDYDPFVTKRSYDEADGLKGIA